MTSLSQKLQSWFRPLGFTPLHPQWLVLRHRYETTAWLKKNAHGKLLDIGCGNGRIRQQLSATVHYIGIDYPTTVALGYRSKPDIFADAAQLPIASSSIDTVVLLDVIEHLSDPDKAIEEAARVLAKNGKCLIHVPFLYPLHDEPHDYQRWTRYGLKQFLNKYSFHIEEICETTHPVETASALLAIALSKGFIDTITHKRILWIFALLVICAIPIINITGWLIAKILSASKFMPFSYRVVASIQSESHCKRYKNFDI
jgi:ubiquinone/menaquinone biosynthesis C-methylase UbiE